MKLKHYNLSFLLVLSLFIFACKKDKSIQPPVPILATTLPYLTVNLNEKYVFSIGTINSDAFSNEWKLDGKVVGAEMKYDFVPKVAGSYMLVYTATNSAGTFIYTYKITVPVPIVAATASSSKYISKVFEYLPAPGQFINEGLGSPAGAQKLVGSITNLVTLGGFGGYVIFGFDHSVVNKADYDLAIYGNPIGGTTPWAEHGIVTVSQDKNGNGLPDDEWYELAGSEYNDPSTIKNYEITYKNPKGYANVTWTDNQGKSGSIDINSFHKHNFYPEFAPNQETLTLKGTLLKSTFGKVGSIFVNTAFPWGYTDSFSVGDNYATNRYNGFDISWAVDASGKKIDLKTIDFVKVYTGQNDKGSALLGEVSTEILGASDLNIK